MQADDLVLAAADLRNSALGVVDVVLMELLVRFDRDRCGPMRTTSVLSYKIQKDLVVLRPRKPDDLSLADLRNLRFAPHRHKPVNDTAV